MLSLRRSGSSPNTELVLKFSDIERFAVIFPVLNLPLQLIGYSK